LAVITERSGKRVVVVEELTVGKIIGAPAGLEKKLLYCCCCSRMKWRRGAGEGDARLLV
jgi:hypothetical protein